MKPILALCTAVFVLTSCDQEKVEDAKVKTAEAAKSVGDLAKDTAGKALEKGKQLTKAAGDKYNQVKDVVVAKGTPALESFKARLNGFSETMKGMKGQAGEDPAKAKEMMTALMAKLNAIPTEGVPPDLSTAFRGYHANMRRILEMSQSVPADPVAGKKWLEDHAQEMLRLEQDSTKALKDLKEAAARHGLTGLDLGEAGE